MENEDCAKTSRTRKTSTYPECLIIPPLESHQQTFILLHGRGSDAATFGPAFLNTEFSGSRPRTLQASFPHTQFIFPTASKRRAQIYHRSIINQWFDNWSLETPNERKELQVQGLRESSAYIHSLLKNEIQQVGAENVVLGGLSQGCACALIALLTWDGEPIAAGFGMCGWLPFRLQIEDILTAVENNGNSGGDDIFEADGEAANDIDATTQALAYLKEELEMPTDGLSLAIQQVPLFLGHGTKDDRVPVELGREAAGCLERLGVNAEWREYDGLGHWYSSAMLEDIVKSLRSKTGWADR
ncbi:MAG: hypothetical protein Q9219_006742 [cf. Caloplaca sp. 3 TL-2023]